MAAKLTEPSGSARRRVFVLVDKGDVKGVFPSWDAAEAYADENRYSLDHLYEFETRLDHPDHLHLMSAKWDGAWKFVGEWSKQTPRWEQEPERIRLDHYHALGKGFHLLRQKDFKWREGVLSQINPMAPDAAIQIDAKIKTVPAPKPAWKPKLAPLKPIQKPGLTPLVEDSASTPATPPTTPQIPLMEEAEPLAGDPPAKPSEPSSPAAPNQDRTTAHEPVDDRQKIAFKKKNRLRLKTDRAGPKPIPQFESSRDPEIPEPPTTTEGLPQTGQVTPEPEVVFAEPEGETDGKARKVWPMRLIVPVSCIFLFWAAGLWWALKPPETTQSILQELSSLSDARVLAIEPGQIFFQMEVDPIQQQRWVRSLGLEPIPFETTLTLPQFHALDTWAKPDGFIRPPYAEIEVREWWDLRLRRISYGFSYKWEDGTVLILDLQSDLILGWGRARNLTELLN